MPEELTFIGPLSIRTLGELTSIAKSVLEEIISRFDPQTADSDCFDYADLALGNVIQLREALAGQLDQYLPAPGT